MKRPFFTLFLVAILLFAGIFVSAPWFAFRALHSAAQANDVQAMAALIDFDAVRKGLESQVHPETAVPAPSFWSDPLGAVKHALQPLSPQHDNNIYLTPSSIGTLSTGSGPPATKAGTFADSAADLIPGAHGRTIRYWGPNRCRIAVHHADGTEAVFTFERRGWVAWKLVQIQLPGKPAPKT